MPSATKTPPGAAGETVQAWLRALGLAGSGSVYESAARAVSRAELDAVRQSVARVAAAQITAEKFAGGGVLAKALESRFPVRRLAEQMSEIAKSHAERLGTGSAEQLSRTYASDIPQRRAAAAIASRLAATSQVAESMKSSAAAAEWAQPRAGILADLAHMEAASEKLARQYGGITTTASARPLRGISAALGVASEARALKAAEALAVDTKRVDAIVAQATRPAIQQQLERMGAFEAAATRLRSPLGAKGFFPSDRFASLFDQSSVFATTKLVETSAARLATQIAGLGSITAPNDLADILERERPLDTIVERFAKRWESTALWFVLSIISVGVLAALDHMECDEVETVLLDALEVVITKGVFTAALDAAVGKADYISPDQRDDLLHGLEHARRGEFVHAVPPLMTGLEGALWSTARALTIVDSERRQLSGKPQARTVVRIEPVLRKLPAKQEYRTFLTNRVFGNLGNPVRHGEQSDRRRQALFAIVAVAGWLDAFTAVSAHEALGLMLSEAIATRRA